jgi:branched-chain amino acid transport system permease protein
MISYLAFMATLAGIYSLLSISLVVVWGQGGMVNLGLVGFYALGAYASALMAGASSPMWLAWVCAAALPAVVALALCYVTRTLRGDYLAIVSLGLAEVIRLVAMNENWLTGGSNGLSGIRSPWKAELGSWHPVFYLVLTWVIVGAVCWALSRLLHSPYGRALRAVRDDDQVAAVAGKPVLPLKLKTFCIGGAIAGVAGALYAHLTSYISPDGFVPLLTTYIFLAVTAGGHTRLLGAIVGAVLVVSVLEVTRFAAAMVPGLDAVRVASLREMVIAIALIAVMQRMPEGLFRIKNQKSRKPRQAKGGELPSSNEVAQWQNP